MSRRLGKIGVYGCKTRCLQRKLSFELFGLTFKQANFYLYLGSRASDVPDISDIQSKAFFEVPDRAYAMEPIQIPIGMEPIPETKSDFSRFGIINVMQDEALFRIHIDDCDPLGRKPMVGDVFEVDFHSDSNGMALWEITDVDTRSEVERFIIVIRAVPMTKSRTTREIETDRDNESLMDSILRDIDEAAAKDVPARGVHQDKPTPEDVDYRDETLSGFLDDPSKMIL